MRRWSRLSPRCGVCRCVFVSALCLVLVCTTVHMALLGRLHASGTMTMLQNASDTWQEEEQDTVTQYGSTAESCGGEMAEAARLRRHSPPGPSEGRVELVITWHCENLEWMKRISPNLTDTLSILVLHKASREDLQKEECNAPIPDVPFSLSVIWMPNCGRDVHSVFAYVGGVFGRVAEYTMFMQADNHWFIRRWDQRGRGFSSNADAVNYFVPQALREQPWFLPVAPQIKGEPILFVDRESNVDTEAQDQGLRLTRRKYDYAWPDMFNQARDTHAAIFGGSPCELPELLYVPGFQFLVSRRSVLARAQQVWDRLAHLSLECEASTYGLERVSIDLFSLSNKTALPPEKIRVPVFCPSLSSVDTDGYFGPRSNPFHAAKFWRKKWGCEPLSAFLQNHSEELQIEDDAASCSWSMAYDVWYGGEFEEKEYSSGVGCLSRCCSDPTCYGILQLSNLDSQCYKFSSVPVAIKTGRVRVLSLRRFNASSAARWSFFGKDQESNITKK